MQLIFFVFLLLAGTPALSSSFADDVNIEMEKAVPIPGPGRLHQEVEAISKDAHERWLKLRKESEGWFDRQALDGHKLKLLKNGNEDFRERYRILESAKRSIYLSAFAFRYEEEQIKVRDLLCRLVKNHVDIRIIADSFGSNFNQKEPGTKMAPSYRKCGIKVMFFAPWRWGWSSIKYAMHEKMLLVDGERGIFGGMSFGSVYRKASRKSAKWHDLDIMVEGPLVCDMQNKFEEMWWKSAKRDQKTNEDSILNFDGYYGKEFRKCERVKSPTGTSRAAGVLWNALFDKKGNKRALNLNYFEAIFSSDKIVRLYAPYFIPHPDMIDMLVAARARGVEVQVISNSPDSTDESDYTNVAMFYSIKPLLDAGVRIFLWNTNATMHRKAAVFDGKWAYVGSDNFDRRAQEYNSESAIFTDDQAIVKDLDAEFEKDLKMSYEIFPKDIPKVLAKKGWFLKWYSKRLIPYL